jgi:AraC-like DNA-binding protein
VNTQTLTVMDLIALAWIGFSIIAATVLGFARFTVFSAFDRSFAGRAITLVCLAFFVVLPSLHAYHLLGGFSVLESRLYLACLCASAAAFHTFFSAALQPPGALGWLYALHLIPITLVPWLPSFLAIPLSFFLGLLFSLHLLSLLHQLKSQRKHFVMERGVFTLFAGLALAIFAMGVLVSHFGVALYVRGYAIAIGLMLALTLYALLRFPDLAERIQETVSNAYAASTLNRVDCAGALQRLQQQLEVEKIYTDESLSLARLAEAVELAPHQLSELINVSFELSFPRFIRKYRVDAAKAMLDAEPKASVLSIGMSVGFTSQSNFYAAFRELTGLSPGAYRSRKESVESPK